MEFQDEIGNIRLSLRDSHSDTFLWLIILGSHRYNKYNMVKNSRVRRFNNIDREPDASLSDAFRKANGLECQRKKEGKCR